MSSLFYGELRRREELFPTADVSPKPFVPSLNNRATAKDFDSRQNGHTERLNGVNRPEYTSLTDVYERALRNVLDIKLNLKCEDNSNMAKEIFEDGLFRDKRPPSHQRRDLLGYKEGVCQKRGAEVGKREDDKLRQSPTLSAPTLLRRPGSTNDHNSAFHVPLKRHQLNESAQEYERGMEARFGDQFGMAPRYPRLGPDFPSEYSSAYRFRFPPSSYGNAMRDGSLSGQSVLAMHRMPLSPTAERYTRWRPQTHARDLPPLFPVHSTTAEQESCFERDVNGNKIERSSTSYLASRAAPRHHFLKDSSSVLGKIKLEKTGDYFERATDHDHSKHLNKNTLPTIPRALSEEARKSPGRENRITATLRHKPYTLRYKQNDIPVNGVSEFAKGTKCRSAARGKEVKICESEGGEKEQFLYKLGLARTDSD